MLECPFLSVLRLIYALWFHKASSSGGNDLSYALMKKKLTAFDMLTTNFSLADGGIQRDLVPTAFVYTANYCFVL